MLNKTTIKKLIAAASLLAIQPALAEENPDRSVWGGFSNFFNPNWEEDFSATIGVKVWMNEWRRDTFYSDQFSTLIISDSKPRAETSDLEATPIPQIGLRYKWLFATGSYYAQTDFNFEPTQRTQSIITNNPNNPFIISTAQDQSSAERYEYDFAGGVYIHPNVAILGGYKRINQTVNVTQTLTDNITKTVTDINKVRSDLDVEGPTIGIAGSLPIGHGFGMYANYAHGFLDAHITDFNVTNNQVQDDVTRDASYDVAELGFTYTIGGASLPAHLPLSAANIYAGYRWQNFETDNPDSLTAGDRSDTTRGFAAGVNFAW